MVRSRHGAGEACRASRWRWNGVVGLGEMSHRFAAVAVGAIAASPAELRARAATRNDPATIERVTDLMRSWGRGAALGQAEFAERFLGRAADDPVMKELRAAAMGAALAKSHAALAEATNHLANAMQGIGLDRWQRFLADAQERARDPATVAAVAAAEKNWQLSDAGKPSISSVPFGPVEAGLALGGVVAALAKDGPPAAASAVGRQIANKMTPKPKLVNIEPNIAGRPIKSLQASGDALDPADTSAQLTPAGRALQKHGGRQGSAFPSAVGNPAAVNKQGRVVLNSILNDPKGDGKQWKSLWRFRCDILRRARRSLRCKRSLPRIFGAAAMTKNKTLK